MMRVLITRPVDDASAFAAALARHGVDAAIEPLLTIACFPGPPLNLGGVQGFLVTSANGVRALAARTPERALRVLAVGDTTARTARDLGFADVESAAGDVAALARLVRDRLDPGAGPLVHVAGTAVAGDLAAMLAADGFVVRREVLYEARPARTLSPATVADLANDRFQGVALFSPRTALCFNALIEQAALVAACRRLFAFCLSQAVADAGGRLPWRRVVVPDRPEQSGLIDAVVAICTETSGESDSLSPIGRIP